MRSSHVHRIQCNPARGLIVVEALERRSLLSAIPTIAYGFDQVAGAAVPNEGAAGARYDGALAGATPPQIVAVNPSPAGGSYIRFFGGRNDASRLDVGDATNPATWLQPILGEGSSTLAFYVRTVQFGANNAAQSPTLTGVDGPVDKDLFLGGIDSEGRMRMQTGLDSATTSSTSINDSLWRHVTLTRDAATGEQRLYVAGELVAESFGTTGPLTTPFRSIGAAWQSGLGSTVPETYLGLAADIDQVEIFSGALTGSEVARRYGKPAANPPSAVPDLEADESYSRGVRLLFAPAADADGYRIFRSDTPDGPYVPIGETPIDPLIINSSRDFFDSDRPAGSIAYYRVVPFNSAGDGPAAQIAARVSADGKGASHLQATVAMANAVEFTWRDDSAGTLRYQLQRSAGGAPFTRLPGTSATATSAIDRTAEPGTTYRYRVAGLDQDQRVVSISETTTVFTALPPSSARLGTLPAAAQASDWLTEANGKLYFRRVDSDQAAALYVADDVTGKLQRLGSVAPEATSGFARPTALGDRVVYAGKDAAHGVELWSTDGTPGGFELLKDLTPGAASSYPVGFTPLGAALVFLVPISGAYGQYQLWRTDGTADGTFQLPMEANVSAFFSLIGDGHLVERAFMRLGDVLYFRAGNDQLGYQLWRTDGSAAGTHIFKDLVPNAPELSWDLGPWGVQNGRLFFMGQGTEQGPGQLFSLDGTIEGTFRVPQTTLSFSRMIESNGRLYMTHSYAIWTINDAGDRVVHLQEAPANEFIRNMAPAGDGGLFYFTTRAGGGPATIALWKSSGVVGELPQRLDTFGELDFGASNFQYDLFNGGLVYHTNDILTVSDGTPQGTVHVASTNLSGSRPWEAGPLGTMVGKRFYYTARGTDGDEIRYISLEEPAAPVDVETRVADDGAVEVSWNDESANETGYLLQRLLVQNAGLPNESETEQARFLLPANTARFVDRPPADATYRYRISAYNTLGRTSAPAESSALSNDIHPPRIARLAVSGSRWSQTFIAFADAALRGDDAIDITNEARPLPWADVDRISLEFDEDVAVGQADLLVSTSGGLRIAAAAFSYDAATHRAAWTLERALPAGRIDVSLSSAVVDRANLQVADARRRIHVLPGDVDGDGKVAATDLVKTRNRIGLQAEGYGVVRKGYSPESDVNADGAVTAVDLVLVRNQVGAIAAPRAASFQFSKRIGVRSRDLEEDLALTE